METATQRSQREPPENLIAGTVSRLRSHAIWDSLLIFAPPLLLAIYVTSYLYRLAWIDQITYLSLGLAFFLLTSIAATLRYRPLVPSVPAAARLVDDKAAAEDRFITLVTIAPSSRPTSLIDRLRWEAASLVSRIDLKRDFPYRVKRSFYGSLVASVGALAMFHLILLTAQPVTPQVPPHEKIRELAEKMVQQPRLEGIGKALHGLAAKLEDPKVPPAEKQAQRREMLNKVQEQQKKEEQQKSPDQGDRDLLDQAANTLKGMEQGAGSEQTKDQETGGGGVQANLPQEGQGQGKSEQGSGDSKGELKAQLNEKMQQGKTAQGDAKEQGSEKNQQNQAEEKGNQPGKSKSDLQKAGETMAKTQSPPEEKAGRSKVSEEVPQGAAPEDRFLKPGEKGKEGIKGADYVTVQLPEELLADSKSGGSSLREAKETKVRPKVPISNVPLPAHVPDAPTEKQHVPLEYRGIIR
jgi:hypothetical protein